MVVWSLRVQFLNGKEKDCFFFRHEKVRLKEYISAYKNNPMVKVIEVQKVYSLGKANFFGFNKTIKVVKRG